MFKNRFVYTISCHSAWWGGVAGGKATKKDFSILHFYIQFSSYKTYIHTIQPYY